MWQVFPDEYVFNTDEKKLADLMQRRKNFELFSIGLNCDYWSYITSKTKSNAKRTLSFLKKKSVL